MIEERVMGRDEYIELLEQSWSFENLPPIGTAEIDDKLPAAVEIFMREYQGKDFPFYLAGNKVMPSGDNVWESLDPNDTDLLIARFPKFDSSRMDMNLVIDTHHAQVNNWANLEKRLEVAGRAHELLLENFWLLTAVQIYEVGRSKSQSANIVNEAADFSRWDSLIARIKYYEPLAPSLPSAGDYSFRDFPGIGVIMGSDPFNFQDAIAWDMLHRSLITGNTYIQKASQHAPLTGYLIFKIWDQAIKEKIGHNNGILSFVVGRAEITDAILSNLKVVGHCFTGSADVLEMIDDKYGSLTRVNGAKLVHPCAEASGVDALYVHEDANLDIAEEATIKSWLPFSGQKCSALSVEIIHENVWDELLGRVERATEALQYGHPADGAYLGAVISEQAQKTIKERISRATDLQGVRIRYTKSDNMDTSKPGYHVTPTIIEVDYAEFKKQENWQGKLRELRDMEIFGPVFIAFKVKNLDEAAEVNNNTSYRLTGGAITDSEVVQNAIRATFNAAGRFYFNRQITASYMGTAGFNSLLSRSGSGHNAAGTSHCLDRFVSEYVEVGVRPKN